MREKQVLSAAANKSDGRRAVSFPWMLLVAAAVLTTSDGSGSSASVAWPSPFGAGPAPSLPNWRTDPLRCIVLETPSRLWPPRLIPSLDRIRDQWGWLLLRECRMASRLTAAQQSRAVHPCSPGPWAARDSSLLAGQLGCRCSWGFAVQRRALPPGWWCRGP